jgi:excisionase family DNA binding protein
MDAPVTLRVGDLSKRYSVPRSTLYHWMKVGVLPSIQIGRLVLVRVEDMERVLLEHYRARNGGHHG